MLGKIKGRWAALFTLFGLTYIAIDLFSTKTPFHVFVNNGSPSRLSRLQPHPHLRVRHGKEVARHPIFGIGLGDWERPSWMSDSMDNFWLVVAVRYGLPAFLMLVALLLGLIWTVGAAQEPAAPNGAARAMPGLSRFSGSPSRRPPCTLWNALFVLFLFLIGAGAWLLDARPEPQNVPGPVPAAKPKLPARALRPARLF